MMKANATKLLIGLVSLLAVASAGRAGDHHTIRFLSRFGSPQSLRAMVFSPDSSVLAVSTSSDNVSFLRTTDAEIIAGYPMTPFSMEYSRDGSRLFMIAESGRVLLDVATGAPRNFELRQEPGFVGTSLERRNGKLLVSDVQPGGPAERSHIQIGDELIGVGQAKAGRMRDLIGSNVSTAIDLLKGPAGSHMRLSLIPRGQLRPTTHILTRQAKRTIDGRMTFADLSAADIQENVAWCLQDNRHTFSNAATGQVVGSIETEDIQNVGQYAISPDSTKFAVLSKLREGQTSTLDSAIEVFDIGEQRREAFVPFPKGSWLTLTFASDSSILLIGTLSTVEILDWRKEQYLEPITLGERVQRLGSAAGGAAVRASRDSFISSNPRYVEAVAASPRGLIAIGTPEGKVTLWSIATRELLATFDSLNQRAVDPLKFSPDGQSLAYFSEGVLHLVDVSDVQPDAELAVK